MSLVIMNKLELVRTLRQIAESEGCHLTLRAASKMADWLKEGTAYNITSWLERQEKFERSKRQEMPEET